MATMTEAARGETQTNDPRRSELQRLAVFSAERASSESYREAEDEARRLRATGDGFDTFCDIEVAAGNLHGLAQSARCGSNRRSSAEVLARIHDADTVLRDAAERLYQYTRLQDHVGELRALAAALAEHYGNGEVRG